MFIRPTKPIKHTTRNGPVVLKPHEIVEVPDRLVKRLLAKAPDQIRKVTR